MHPFAGAMSAEGSDVGTAILMAIVRAWLESLRPDLFIVVYNDHANQFFFNAYPTLALGAAEIYPQADEGWGKRDLPDMPGDPAFSWHLAQSLVDDEFDPTICQEMAVDHGVLSFMPMLTNKRWVPIVPLAVNVIQQPVPTARRLYNRARHCDVRWRAIRRTSAPW
jgi:protocatechuate 4,5-dioxygenase beta chain